MRNNLEPNDLPITHEDHLFDNGRVYGNKGSLNADCDAVKSEFWTPAGKIEENATAKYLKLTQHEFESLAVKCAAAGEPLSLYQQHVVSHLLASAYQDGMIAALREQTDKALKGE